ncbi:putative 23S rRNA ribose 2'-O-ribose methyltransferase [Roseimaritima multifibrata]|uniref:Putative 23S rRNA ribose 2'-O-ribose methyltransferase n=1 Tax=Roseimaritima multifibrata TaxID=1930274 RepID=A0A517ME90_9BACT|nr:SAM-dependent methyltransferase [Roseimaritima multifibrata]QDS93202.1 putative 23S rRNA ribose 2'-O-ribose methyltransferase [Roseimaritima multifibrata]
MSDAQFVMVACQRGAEGVLKEQLGREGLRLAFSRPGFVTFKVDPEAADAVAKSLPRNPFARAVCHAAGKSRNSDLEVLLAAAKDSITKLRQTDDRPFDQLHVWSRDRAVVGEFGFEPHAPNPLVEDLAERLFQHLSASGDVVCNGPNLTAGKGQRIFDVIIVDPGEWWFGWHLAEDLPTRWPGAIQPIDADKEVVSRAYFKLAEALAWAGFPMRPGDLVVEVGSAPGGACQRLLELGFKVTGIDPAEMDEEILEHRHMTHVLARAEDLKISEFRDYRWLIVDATLKPPKVLSMVGRILSHSDVRIQGIVLTLKLGDYDRAAEIPGWIQQVERWGFPKELIQVRQLATGRCEVCLIASHEYRP